MNAKLINLGKGKYSYCGEIVQRNKSIPQGQYGRWCVWPHNYFGSQQAAIAYIDKKQYDLGIQAAKEGFDLPEDCNKEFERGWREELDRICRRIDHTPYIKAMAKQLGL